MAKLLDTFPQDAEGRALFQKVKKALHNLTGMTPPKDGNFTSAPRRLNAERDTLKSDWRAIWFQETIKYDAAEPGASVLKGVVKIGPFFLQKRFTVMDMEKVVLHEYLHEAIDISWRDAHHGQIDQIIQFNLAYPGAPNPAEGKV